MTPAPQRKQGPAPPHPPRREQPAAAPVRRWPGLVAGAILVLVSLLAAWLQPVRPDGGAETPAPGRVGWWLHPLERNPPLRLPRVQGDLAGVFALPGTTQVWAVGRKGLILHAEDGASWEQQHPKPQGGTPASAGRAHLPALVASAHAGEAAAQRAVAEPPGEWAATPVQGAAVEGKGGLPAETDPAALKKRLLAEETKRKPVSAKAAAPRRAPVPPVAAPPAPTEATPPALADVDLVAVQFDDAQNGWAASAQGIALITRNGGRDWAPPRAGEAKAAGRAMPARSAVPPPQGTLATAWADGQRAWAVGPDGLILASRDGGGSWQRQTRPAGWNGKGGYARLPAPWTYVAFMLGVGLMLRAGRGAGQTGAAGAEGRTGIAGLFVSDHPLGPGEPDPLGYGQLAEGLARFILNRNTEPGLTLAITGPWGSGKSSIMRLLQYRLQAAGFRPAWFNAWHHQQEGRQLASLSNAIRLQAVPPLHALQGWRVRGALIWKRGLHYRLLIFGILAIVLLGGFEVARQEAPLDSLRQALLSALTDSRTVVVTPASLEKLGQGRAVDGRILAALERHMMWNKGAVGTGACTASDGDCSFAGTAQLLASVERLIAPRRLTDEERAAIEGAAQHLGAGPQSMLAVLLSVLVVPMLLGKGLAVYGLNYLDLLKRLLPERGRVAGKEAVGTMANLATEFDLLTEALDGRLVLFIDDLDRCGCQTVREVLELVNYLASVGQCFIVLGMAMEHVTCCIEAKTADQDRDEYARQYLKKLINIEVPVPALDEGHSRELLARQAGATEPPPPPPAWRGWLGDGVLTVLVLCLVLGLPLAWEQLQPPAQAKTFTVVAARPAPAGPEPAGAMPGRGAGPAAAVGLEPAVLPGASWTLIPLPAAVLLGLAAWLGRHRWLPWLRARGWLPALRRALGQAERGDDRPEFGAALLNWHDVILLGDPTPRGVKRFVNRVRFLAMMEQSQAAAERIPDTQLVALAALHHARLPLDGGNNEHAHAAMAQSADWPPAGEHLARFERLVQQLHIR